MTDVPTASMLIVGNEILSGRTQDKNLNYIAQGLTEIGIHFAEARIVPDIEAEIVEALNALRAKYTYVFTTGGIGPTHDDITSAAVAKAFNLPLERNKEAEARLRNHYVNRKEELNAARLKMADIPVGAHLVDNPVSAAPGFIIENVYVMAGVPVIMQAMFDNIKPTLTCGPVVLSKTIVTDLTEGTIAQALGDIQYHHPEVEIGSYPHIRHGRLGVSLVMRSPEAAAIEKVQGKIAEIIRNTGGNIVAGEQDT